jgi:hypothetical protein
VKPLKTWSYSTSTPRAGFAKGVRAGRFAEGDTIVVEPDGETLKFKKEAPAAVAS